MHYSSEILLEQKTLSALELLKLAIGNQQLLDNYNLCHNVRSSNEKAYSQSKAPIDLLSSSSTMQSGK